MKKIKTITIRLNEDEHEKLLNFAQKQKLSLNNILKKAIQLNFNFKTQDVIKSSQFLTSNTSADQELSPAQKTTLHAALESLFIMRGLGTELSEEMVKNAHALAKQKVSELID